MFSETKTSSVATQSELPEPTPRATLFALVGVMLEMAPGGGGWHGDEPLGSALTKHPYQIPACHESEREGQYWMLQRISGRRFSSKVAVSAILAWLG